MRKLTVAVLVIIVFAGAAGLWWNQRDESTGSEEVVINQAAKTLLYLPLYIANRRGFFADEGLDARIITGGGDSQALAAVIGESADVGQGDPMMVPLSLQQGGPGKIVGNVVARVAFWGVTMNDELAAIEEPADFKGLRVVTYPEPMTIYALQKQNVLKAGLALGQDSHIVQAQFGTELAPLFAGDADVTMTLEPVVSQAVEQGARVVYSFPDKYGEFTLTGLMVSDELIRDRPDFVQRILNAYQRALTFAHENPDGAVAVAREEFSDVDPEILEAAVHRMLDEETIPRVVTISMESYEKAHGLRRYIGDLNQDVSYAHAVNNSFAEAAVSQYGPK